MPRLTAQNLANAIAHLNPNVDYNYINRKNHGQIRIINVDTTNCTIQIKRWNPTGKKARTPNEAEIESISSEMLWRVANAIDEDVPINIDRILGASYNTRAVLETLLACTPQFWVCRPGRIMTIDGHSEIEKGHKHLIYKPNEAPHRPGITPEIPVHDMAISEIPIRSVTYSELRNLPTMNNIDMTEDDVRRHVQIQISLYEIGKHFGFKTWIAANDNHVIYQDQPLINHPNMIQRLTDVTMLNGFNGAAHAGNLIDCIWFSEDEQEIIAVMEVEHTTGVTSGLTRMNHFRLCTRALHPKYIIVAPDEDREMACNRIRDPQFSSLHAQYFSYSALEDLLYLCKYRNIRGVLPEFIDSFTEEVH